MTEDKTSGANAHDYTYTYDGNDNRLTSSETGALTFWTYDIANRLVTSVSGGLTTTYTFDRNGNKTIVRESVNIYTLGYDNMNRLNYQIDGSNRFTVSKKTPGDLQRFTYTYDASNLKRYEDAPTGRTTIVWDGFDYLEGRS